MPTGLTSLVLPGAWKSTGNGNAEAVIEPSIYCNHP